MSIDPRELRIGNWANYDGKTPGYVMEFDLKQVKLKCKASTLTIRSSRNVSSLDIDPIPLTPEILIAAGFVNETPDGKYFHNYWLPNRYGIAYCINETHYHNVGSFNCGKTDIEIKSLHQLQNLYWCLCGEELTIKL